MARTKEVVELAGIILEIIRADGCSGIRGHGAGMRLVFTMMSMSVSAMVVVCGTGNYHWHRPLFDTLVIRAFMTPSIAALLGPWFW